MEIINKTDGYGFLNFCTNNKNIEKSFILKYVLSSIATSVILLFFYFFIWTIFKPSITKKNDKGESSIPKSS